MTWGGIQLKDLLHPGNAGQDVMQSLLGTAIDVITTVELTYCVLCCPVHNVLPVSNNM